MFITLLKLIRSLSKTEKRYFQLSTKKHQGPKIYYFLFNLINNSKHNNLEEFKSDFYSKFPNSSFEATVSYLTQLIIETIIQQELNRNPIFKLHFGILTLQILKDRNIDSLLQKELNKLKNIASTINYPTINYILTREELNFLSSNSFRNISEKDLIYIQQRGRDNLTTMRNTFDHYSLYETIKFRMNKRGKSISVKDQKSLDDLLLEELSIINTRVKHNLESKKIHHLFHSLFFTNIGDYESALKSFKDLNSLFEKNEHLWIHTPIDYITVLDGILDSLRALRKFDNMDIYINKLEKLSENNIAYPLNQNAKNIATLYKIIKIIGYNKYWDAFSLIEEKRKEIDSSFGLLNNEKISEIFFYFSLVYFKCGKMKKAQNSINLIQNMKHSGETSLIIRATSLLNLLIYYEVKDYDYLDYAIRAHRRSYYRKENMLDIEKLLIKLFKEKPATLKLYKKQRLWNLILPELKIIKQDPYEMQLLKYYDFIDWVESEFNTKIDI